MVSGLTTEPVIGPRDFARTRWWRSGMTHSYADTRPGHAKVFVAKILWLTWNIKSHLYYDFFYYEFYFSSRAGAAFVPTRQETIPGALQSAIRYARLKAK